MTRANIPSPSVDELIALLKRSSLPTLIVEGKDDLIIYKRLEDRFYEDNLSVLPVGGRKNVLTIYERLNELPPSSKILFIADQDNWAVTGIPPEYHSEKLFFTNGYSVENDAFTDGRVTSYMSIIEQQRFTEELRCFLTWYALALERNLTTGDEEIKIHPNQILDNQDEFSRLTTLKQDESFPQARLNSLSINYESILRGKSLMQLAMRQLSYTGRAVRHSDKSFLEHVAVNPGPLIGRIIGCVEAALKLPRTGSDL